MQKQTKYIFITGGVVSSIGKGITAASIGRLLKNRGLKVFMQKFDPYINYDPSGMSPIQHGEVFVTADGGETDLDLGHYERFIDEELTKHSNITAGKIYKKVIEKERAGRYNGQTVQVIPHITNEIKSYIYKVAKESDADIVITEIGGTIGDIEGLPFLEAIRQVRRETSFADTIYIHTTLVPYLKATKEIKTKPTQHSVKELRSIGIQPDIIVLRGEVSISQEEKEKIALFCDVNPRAVIEAIDVDIIYEIVNKLHEQKIDDIICQHFNLTTDVCDITEWKKMIDTIKSAQKEIKIGLVGKYTSLHDAYKSVVESLSHAGFYYGYKVDIVWLDSEIINNKNVDGFLQGLDGIIVPGGFGQRGTEGMIETVKYARINKTPYFGICLGMQIALIEIARNVSNLKDATSIEFDEFTKTPVITYMPGQQQAVNIAGTLRIGLNPCVLKRTSRAYQCYQKDLIFERHRHRLEFNNQFMKILENAGVNFAGMNPDSGLVEVIELNDHPWFVGCQFHPEFSSRPNKPNPLFLGFVNQIIALKNKL